MFDKLQVCAVAVRLLAPKIGEIRRETRERERERQEFCWPPAICRGVIMGIKFQNCSRLDTGEVIDTKEAR